jgi:hypothetical protein
MAAILTSTLQDAIELSFIQQLWVLGSNWFLLKNGVKDGCGWNCTYQFNGNFFISFDVCAYKTRGINTRWVDLP